MKAKNQIEPKTRMKTSKPVIIAAPVSKRIGDLSFFDLSFELQIILLILFLYNKKIIGSMFFLTLKR